jgi:hypothetical protein
MKLKHHIPICNLPFDINGDILSINHFQTMKNQNGFATLKTSVIIIIIQFQSPWNQKHLVLNDKTR